MQSEVAEKILEGTPVKHIHRRAALKTFVGASVFASSPGLLWAQERFRSKPVTLLSGPG